MKSTCLAACIVALISFSLCYAQSEESNVASRSPLVETQLLLGRPPISGPMGFFHALAVDHDGDTLVAGAGNWYGLNDFGPLGAVFVFQRDHEGKFHRVAQLTASDAQINFNFGQAVAISGDGNTIVAGVPNFPFGAVYVFEKPMGGWRTMTETAKLIGSGQPNQSLGNAVEISYFGDTIFTSHPFDGPRDNNNQPRGEVFVFLRQGKRWQTTSQFSASLTVTDGLFLGYSLSLSADGTTLVSGAIGDQTTGAGAYVFVKPAEGWRTATETAKLTGSDSVPFDEFGLSVSADRNGHAILVGAPNPGSFPYPAGSGSAYLFVRPKDGWMSMTETAKLTPSDGQIGDQFGFSVALTQDGRMAAIGSFLAPFAMALPGPGAAYLFYEPHTGWKTTADFQQKLDPSTFSGGGFGSAALFAEKGNNKSLVVAAPFVPLQPISGAANNGVAYVFENKPRK